MEGMKMAPDGGYKRSSFCESAGCVEWQQVAGIIYVRDSENPGVVLRFWREEWREFVQGVKAGEFDVQP